MKSESISTQRASLMGLAAIMIAVFHTDILYPHTIDLIKNLGDFGVNIFFAVSGFSMCYAWRKNPDSLTFIKNRFLRVMITALPISVIWNALSYFTHESTLTKSILKTLTIQFWIDGNLFQWFVSGILLLYLITPFWMKFYERNKFACLIVTSAICILCLVLPYFKILKYIICFIQRIPVYSLGLCLGKQVIENKEANIVQKYAGWILLFIGILGFIVTGFNTVDYKWKYIFYALMTYQCLMIISFLLAKLNANKKFVVLPFIGTITLEIYLFQEKILKLVHLTFDKLGIAFDQYNITINIIVIASTILLSYIYHKITDKIYHAIRSK